MNLILPLPAAVSYMQQLHLQAGFPALSCSNPSRRQRIVNCHETRKQRAGHEPVCQWHSILDGEIGKYGNRNGGEKTVQGDAQDVQADLPKVAAGQRDKRKVSCNP